MTAAATVKRPDPLPAGSPLAVSIANLDIRFGDKDNEITALSNVSVNIPEERS